jgi:nitrite transporter NirC
MTLLSLAVIGRHADAVTLAAALYNLGMVTLGNVLGGAVMVGGLYWLGDACSGAYAGHLLAGSKPPVSYPQVPASKQEKEALS